MLTKIISIKNIGQFENSTSKSVPILKKHSIVYAPNASGKSTLCAILRSLDSHDSTEMLGRKRLGSEGTPEVKLLISSQNVSYSNQVWSGNAPPIAIFDSAYIERNVYSGNIVDLSNRRQLFRIIIGHKGVALAEREVELTNLANDTQKEIRNAEESIEAISGSMSAKKFTKLSFLPDAEKTIADKVALIESLKVADIIVSKNMLEKYQELTVPLEILDVLATNINDLGDKSEATLKNHMNNHNMKAKGQAWVQEGLSYVVDDMCPLCGRSPFNELSLVQAFRSLLSENYQKLQSLVKGYRDTNLDREFGSLARGEIARRFETNNSLLSFWKDHCEFESVPESVGYIIEAVRAIESRLMKHLEKKLGAVSESAISDQDQVQIKALFEAANKAIRTANAEIGSINRIIDSKKSSVDNANLETEKEALLHLQMRLNRQSEKGAMLCTELNDLCEKKKKIVAEKTKVRQELDEQTNTAIEPYEKHINFLLERFGAGFSILKTSHSYSGGVASASYQLKINNVEIGIGDAKTPASEVSFRNTLSNGDKSTLALAFFLASLEQNDRLKDSIVVFDDPINSLDASRRNQTIEQILRIAKRCRQVIILSHNIPFVVDIWQRLPESERTAVQIVNQTSSGSKLEELDIEKAFRGRLRKEIDALLDFHKSRKGEPLDIAKKLRVVCESFFRFAYTGLFKSSDSFGKIL